MAKPSGQLCGDFQPGGYLFIHTTAILRPPEHVRQAQENSPKKSRPLNHWQWHTHGLLVHWCSN